MRGQKADPKFVEDYEKTLTTKMDGFERILSKQKYMAGDVCRYPVDRA